MSRTPHRLLVVFTMLMLILGTPACAETTPEAASTPEPQVKILFIGTSLTYYNSGLHHHIVQLAGSADPPVVIVADKVTRSGAPLERLWEDYSEPREKIAEGDYDVVVLQDGIPLTDIDTFHEYTRLFVAEIRDAGAEPLLFMTWARMRISTEEIAQAYRDIAMELGVDVAPVGLAWQRAMDERPELNLYTGDGIHPNIHGTYLTVCVVYATILGESPIGLTYLPSEDPGVNEDEGAFLQRIAWETVQDYQAEP